VWNGRTVTLPAAYVQTSVELGYASTVHTAQGVTADTMHGVVSGEESRQQLYTMLTRGRSGNHIYLSVVGDKDPHAGPVGLPIPAAVEAVVAGPSGGCRHRADSAQPGERGFRADPVGIVTGGDQQLRGGFWAEPWPAPHGGGEFAGQPVQLMVGGVNLLIQLADADREPAQAPFHRGVRAIATGPVPSTPTALISPCPANQSAKAR
jgi:hypothetical protein